MELEALRDRLRTFAAERDWEQFHTPRNLALALVGEVGELAEILQWRTDEEVKALVGTSDGSASTADELADVLIYLVRLADVLGLDLGEAALAKIDANALRYPSDQVRGSKSKRPRP